MEGLKLAEKSYQHAVRRAAHAKGIILPENISRVETENDIPTNLVLRPTLCDEIKEKILKAMEDIKFTKLEVNIIGNDLPAVGMSLRFNVLICSCIIFHVHFWLQCSFSLNWET